MYIGSHTTPTLTHTLTPPRTSHNVAGQTEIQSFPSACQSVRPSAPQMSSRAEGGKTATKVHSWTARSHTPRHNLHLCVHSVGAVDRICRLLLLLLVQADEHTAAHAAQEEDDRQDDKHACPGNLPTDAVAVVATVAQTVRSTATFWRTDVASVCDALARACPPASTIPTIPSCSRRGAHGGAVRQQAEGSARGLTASSHTRLRIGLGISLLPSCTRLRRQTAPKGPKKERAQDDARSALSPTVWPLQTLDEPSAVTPQTSSHVAEVLPR